MGPHPLQWGRLVPLTPMGLHPPPAPQAFLLLLLLSPPPPFRCWFCFRLFSFSSFFLPSFRPALPTSFVGAELALDAESCSQFLAALPLCYCGPDSIDCKQSLGVLPHF